MTRAWQDCRFGVRVLVHNWRLAAVIVLTIAVTVGASATVLSVVTPVLLKPLPFSDPERLYRVAPTNAKGQRVWISVPTLTDWQDRVRDARFAGYSIYDFSVFGDEGPEPILAARVTEGFLDVLGVRTSLGRAFETDEHRAGGPRSVILTYGFWQRRYGADPTIIGRRIDFAGPAFLAGSSGEYRVIGVLPPEFWLFSSRLEIVLPLRMSPDQLANRRRSAIETVLARFEPGVTREVAGAQVSDVVRELALRYGAAEPVVHASTTEAQAAHYEEFRPRLLLALVSAVLMFVLAIVNVAAMLIALAVSRQKEFAVRAALGVSRFGLFRQSLTEGLLLGAAGGATGLFLGVAGTSVLRTVVPGPLVDRIPGQAGAITVDAQVAAFVGGAVLLMSVLCGLTTFLATGGARLESTLREASRATTDAPKYGRLRTAILAPQLALAVALVVTTSILAVSLVQLQSVDLGLNTERLVSFWLNLDARRYPSARQRADFFERVIDRVRAVPDVQAVSGIDLPANQNWQKTRIVRADQRAAGDAQLPEVFARAVTPEYFQVLGVRMLAGRAFGPGDVEGTLPVAIVSRTLADRLWPDRDALGQQIRAGGADASEPWLTVVGIAADVRRVPHEPPTATLYRPVPQSTPAWLYLMIRARSESADLAPGVRQAVWAEDPRQPIEGPYVIARWVREMTALLRFVVLLGLSFSVLGILLAFTGVYGLTADLSQRAIREIGIRKALGATTAEIIRLYMYRSARPAIPALLVGGVVGTGVIRALASELEGVASSPLGVTLLVMTVFGALVILATYLASRRAADVNPALTMRVE
ncbi:MAG: ABC transporter permease [Vicinamibacterales bacterium]